MCTLLLRTNFRMANFAQVKWWSNGQRTHLLWWSGFDSVKLFEINEKDATHLKNCDYLSIEVLNLHYLCTTKSKPWLPIYKRATLTSCKNQSNRSQWKSKWCKTCVTATRTVFSFQNVASKQTTRSHNYEIVICCSQAKNQSKHQSMVAINKPCLNIQSTKGHKAFLSIVLTVPIWWWSVSLPYNLTVCVRILL